MRRLTASDDALDVRRVAGRHVRREAADGQPYFASSDEQGSAASRIWSSVNRSTSLVMGLGGQRRRWVAVDVLTGRERGEARRVQEAEYDVEDRLLAPLAVEQFGLPALGGVEAEPTEPVGLRAHRASGRRRPRAARSGTSPATTRKWIFEWLLRQCVSNCWCVRNGARLLGQTIVKPGVRAPPLDRLRDFMIRRLTADTVSASGSALRRQAVDGEVPVEVPILEAGPVGFAGEVLRPARAGSPWSPTARPRASRRPPGAARRTRPATHRRGAGTAACARVPPVSRCAAAKQRHALQSIALQGPASIQAGSPETSGPHRTCIYLGFSVMNRSPNFSVTLGSRPPLPPLAPTLLVAPLAPVRSSCTRWKHGEPM